MKDRMEMRLMKSKSEEGFKSPLTDLIDDSTYGRFDKRKSDLYSRQYLAEDKEQSKVRANARKSLAKKIREKRPGYGLKDVALHGAAKSMFFEYGFDPQCEGANRLHGPHVHVQKDRYSDRRRLRNLPLCLPLE